jgi:hypothetical protein
MAKSGGISAFTRHITADGGRGKLEDGYATTSNIGEAKFSTGMH